MRVERNIIVGCLSTWKKSAVRKCASRRGRLVSIEARSMVASTWNSVPEGPMSRETSKTRKRPRTLLRPRKRLENVIVEWLRSLDQRPGVSASDEARVWVADDMVWLQ